MDNVPSILSFDQSTDELCQQYTIQQDELLLLTSCEDGSYLINQSDYFWPTRKASISFGVNDGENPNDCKKKKIIHRDIERLRRQEMETLYRTLRSLLPLQYIKGTRTISDHMHGAVNYIKDLQNKIKESSHKRDELNRFCNSSHSTPASAADQCSHSSCPQESVVLVKPCLAGVEVVINTDSRQGFCLSRVFKVLIAEGLNVVNCISAEVNGSLMHNIVSEVGDGRSINLCELQEKLMKLTV